MRTIVCRYQNSDELSRHLIYDGKDLEGPCAIGFLSAFEGHPGENLKLLLVVEGIDERCSVRVRLWEQGSSGGRRTCFGEIDARDRVWAHLLTKTSRARSRFATSLAS